ncbi:MAG TPA: MFS transporter [Gemmatimonadota bacterium]|nr:MFS transporter [Gemmatimonadota bacterium]
MPRILERVGLGRPELRAWALYDWANSAWVLTIQTAVFPVYFLEVAAADLPEAVALQRYTWTTSIALAVIALTAPILGAVADFLAARKRMLGTFLSVGVVATACMVLIDRGEWLLAAVLFGAANIGAQGAFVFYDSLLPHIAGKEEVDRVSTAGYALGYLGSAILLALQIGWIVSPGTFGLPSGTLPSRLAFLSVAVWWALFSIPLFRGVPEPPRRIEPDETRNRRPVRVAITRLGETFRNIRGYRQAFLLLIAFLVYNDGIGTIIRMAQIYGAALGLDRNALIGAIFVAQLVGIPFTILFAGLAGRIGAKRAILLGLAVYVGVTIYGYFLDSAREFYAMAIVVGMVQGGCQALSRSLFASLVPRHMTGEFFGFYGVLDKFAAVTGPALFGAGVALTGSVRSGVLTVLVYFLVGAFLLTRVDVEAGRNAAREAERDLVPLG